MDTSARQVIYVKKSRKSFVCDGCKKWIDKGNSCINIKEKTGMWYSSKRYHNQDCITNERVIKELIK